jgi:hypothetical protein
MALILFWITGWCVGVVIVGELLAGKPWWVQTPFYLVTGIVWIFPLRPLLRWMETGRWHVLDDPE